MLAQKFNNIITPIIRTNLNLLQSVTLTSPSFNVIMQRNKKRCNYISTQGHVFDSTNNMDKSN